MGKGKAAELQAELHDELQRERDKNAGLEEEPHHGEVALARR